MLAQGIAQGRFDNLAVQVEVELGRKADSGVVDADVQQKVLGFQARDDWEPVIERLDVRECTVPVDPGVRQADAPSQVVSEQSLQYVLECLPVGDE